MGKKTQKQTVGTRFKGPKFRPTFIQKWRKYRGLSQQRLADRVGMTGGNLSEIENGNTAYTQATLEALAEALNCEPADLIMRDPTDVEAPWSIWERLKPAQRKQAIRLLRALEDESTEAA